MAGSPTRPEPAANEAFAARLVEHARRAAAGADPVREVSCALLAKLGLPSGRKLETWKYTDLRAFYRSEWLDRGAAGAPSLSLRAANGGALPSGIVVAQSKPPAPLPTATNARVDLDRYPLAIVNTLLADEWITLEVAAGVDAGALELADAGVAGRSERILVRLGAGSRAHLIETESTAAANRVVEVELGADAQLTHDRYESSGDTPRWSLVAVDVGERARYVGSLCTFSAAPRRADVHVKLRGREARTELTGALGSGEAGQLDVQVVVEHFGRASVSRQTFHGLAAQRSQLTFNGRIEIHPGADGTDARLDSRNLLLASTARINTKPELEIHTRDVRCGHGATVGRLDPEQLFYLRTRGIDADAARALLTRAFVAACLFPDAIARGLHDRFAALAR